MVWNVFFVFVFSMSVVNSMEGYYQPPRSSAVWGYFTPPLLQRVPLQSQQTAMEAMVELTNNLGVAILQDHSFSRGNFAFSPYGVASVLVVLYEGARSESARQIHRAVGFPLDKDIIRVGFRDVHRHLRSYFSHEGYLSGISLNKQSSSLKPEYKKILKFYGYDVDLNLSLDDENDLGTGNNIPDTSSLSPKSNKTTASPQMVLTEAPEVTPIGDADKKIEDRNSTTSSSTMATSPITLNPAMQKPMETVVSTETNPPTTVTEEFAQNSTENIFGFENKKTDKSDINETIPTVIPVTESQDGTTVFSETVPQNRTTVLPATDRTTVFSETVPQDKTTVLPATDGTTVFPETVPQDKTTVLPATDGTTVFPETVPQDKTTVLPATDGTTVFPETVPQDKTIVLSVTDRTTVLTTTEDGDEFQINLTVGKSVSCKERLLCNNTKEKTTQMLENQTETTPLTEEKVTEAGIKTTGSKLEEITNVSIDNGMLIPQPDDRETTTTEKVSTKIQSSEEPTSTTEAFSGTTEAEIAEDELGKNTHHNVNKIMDIINSRASLWLSEKTRKRKTRTIADYLKSPHNPDLSLQLQNGMYDTHVSRNADLYRKLPRLLFLVDGAVDTPVPMMMYTNVFSYAYIPRLHSKALEFPLDDVRYKLLILLPVERRGLRQLIYDLADFPLSNVLETVRPARVKAMIPTFMVEGFVILTSSLQKLGIWDVFDPRKANLSGMSTDPELYVRNVEQSVTVVIRNYVEILDIQTRTMAARQMEYEFEATHPFLYFVLDTATNVALMAGQILDPLNSRIY